jgi:hypothetical protein
VRYIVVFWLVLYLVDVPSLHGQTPALHSLIRTGQHKAELLDVAQTPRFQALLQQFQAAAQADPTWFQQHAATAKPGEPLPYHPKLGLSRSEYQEFLRLLTTMQWRPVDTVLVVIESTKWGYRVGAGTEVPSLRGLEIDTVARSVRTSVGVLAPADPIVPSDGQQATGEWGGPRWKLQGLMPGTLTGTHAEFAVGRHSASGRTILYFDVTKAQDGQVSVRETRFLKLLP